MSIEVKIEDYCQDCKDFVVQDLMDVDFLLEEGRSKLKHVVTCKNYSKCKKIEKTIREAICNEEKHKG